MKLIETLVHFDCSTCDGNGEIPTSGEWRLGADPEARSIICPDCRGTGLVDSVTEDEPSWYGEIA